MPDAHCRPEAAGRKVGKHLPAVLNARLFAMLGPVAWEFIWLLGPSRVPPATAFRVQEGAPMKERLPTDRELSPPGELCARATLLVMLVAVACGILLTIAGVVRAQPHWSATGLLVVGLAWVMRSWLQRRDDAPPAGPGLNELLQETPPLSDSRAAELVSLLDEWEAMEAKRGSPEFDPWALQVLRNDIRRTVASDPALEELFTRLQRAA